MTTFVLGIWLDKVRCIIKIFKNQETMLITFRILFNPMF